MAYLRGRIYHFVAPSSLGIDAYKTYCVNRYHRGRTAIVSSILVERGFGLLSSLAILLIMLPFSADILDLPFKQHITWVSISGLFFLGLSIHLMQSRADFILNLKFPGFFPAKAHGLLEGLVINLAKVKDGKKNIWFYFLLSIIEKSFYGIAVFLCARTLGITEPGLLFILSVAPVCALLERLPISVSAIGVREGLFVILFAPFHDDPTIPIAVSLVLRLGEVVQIVIFFSTWFIGRNPSVINKELQTVERKYGSKHNQY